MQMQHYFLAVSILILLHIPLNDSLGGSQARLIATWAQKLGKELWFLGDTITKKSDIERNYDKANLSTKDPYQIISEIVGNMSSMIKRKTVALNCIIQAAEQAAEKFNLTQENRTYEYYRSNPPPEIDEWDNSTDPDIDMYKNMEFDEDTHFFNLPINTSYSSVHLPTNVYHRHDEPETAIRWSEKLDETFKQNYNADPSLLWQYFGSTSGIMRHYPAIAWSFVDNEYELIFDCRIRTWFIEAATCSKDVVILLDNSGSMTGWNNHIAFLTVKTIFQTLSNNDYVNIVIYSSNTTEYLVPCFEAQLVQATEENIEVFQDSLKTLNPQNGSMVDRALGLAYELLYKYRVKHNCSEPGKFCSQAVMIITDGIPVNLNEVIDEFSEFNNESNPIRIFTYIIGKEASNIEQSLSVACNNRGYHTHISSLEQVTSAVYKYILVLARPLVLHRDHQFSWTHSYHDLTFQRENKQDKKSENYRLLTTVAGPAYKLKAPNDDITKSAQLLGVAGIDVSIDDIQKLMFQYKTGVMAHSFIVSNNGYVIMHPGLRPAYYDKSEEGYKLTINYNSIDITEVEQLDDDLGPRTINGSILEELRTALIQQEYGVIHDIKIKYHYDNMRRVSREINDYYFARILNTPFTIGFAIPDLYGNYSIEVTDELYKYRSDNISTYFTGSNWKIHPEWVYCKYHYLEGHEYDSPEEELLHFINKMNTKNFEWSMQYEDDQEHKEDADCGAKTLGDNDYYCDRYLVQRVVFDAMHTKLAFNEPWNSPNKEDHDRLKLFDVKLRFMATMSGFSRWEYLADSPSDGNSTFGDDYPKAIDEIWYKSAVIQHRYNNNSFVYSVPYDTDEDKELIVTGSFAVFPNKNDIEAPAAVVGLQFSHQHLQDRFFNITSTCKFRALNACEDLLLCGSELECYVIDSSGYIIISKDDFNVGKFFGDIEGVTMEAMIYNKIFQKLTIRDYQAMCYYQQWVKGDSSTLLQPFQYIIWILRWTFSRFAWLIIQMNLHQLWDARWMFVDAEEEINVTTTPKPKLCLKRNCKEEEEWWHLRNQIPKYDPVYTACEKEHDLYILDQTVFTNETLRKKFSEQITYENCTRPFYLQTIPHSNLLLVAINTQEEEICYYVHTTEKRDIVYDDSLMFPCQKLYLNDLVRRPLEGCYHEHPLERQIAEQDCGRSRRIELCRNLLVLIILTLII